MDTEVSQQDNERAQDDMKISQKRPKNENRKGGRTIDRMLSQQYATDSPQRQEDITSQPNTTTPPIPPNVPMSTVKIATLNINDITSRTSVGCWLILFDNMTWT